MTKDKALKLALEALLINCGGNTEGIGKEAITAIKQALPAAQRQSARSALKLALEALEFNQANWQGKDRAITAIKEALAAPVQPAQRTWVGLTDDDYRELHLEMGPTYFYQDYGRAIEAKLKEKNT